MNQMDERVVVLEFDNKNFEKNTQQSIKTLENLDNSLKNAGSANGLQKLGAAAKKIDLSSIASGVETISSRFTDMGLVGQTVIRNLTDTAVNFGKKVLHQMVSGGWNRAANIEKAKFQIEGLKGVWDETSKGYVEGMKTIKEAVNNAVDSTAYGLDEAAVIGSQLMASGITDADKLEEHLKSVSGLAAMTGGSYADIGRIYAQVAGQGRLMGDQLLQISQRGINVAATLKNYANAHKEVKDAMIQTALASGKNKKAMEEISKHSKLTESDIREMVSTGVVSFELFSAAMGDAFAEHAKDANKTFDGALSNMKAALNRIGAEFATPLRENLKNLFNAITPLINNIKAALMPFINVIVAAGKKVTGAIVKILNAITKVTTPVEKANAAAKKASKTVSKLTKIMTISKRESKAAFDIWNKGTYGNGLARRKALEKEGMSYKHVQGYVNALIKYNFDLDKVHKHIRVSGDKVSKTLKKQTKSTKGATKATKELARHTKILMANEKWRNVTMRVGVEKAWKLYKVKQKELAQKRKEREEQEKEKKRIEILTKVLTALKFAFMGVRNIALSFVNVAKILGAIIKATLFPILSRLFDITKKGGGKLLVEFKKLTGIFENFTRGALKPVSDFMAKHVTPAIESFIDKVSTAFGKVRTWFRENQLLSRTFHALGQIISNVASAVYKFFQSIKDYFEKNKEGQRAAEVLKKIWNVVKEMAKGALTKVVDDLERLSRVNISIPNFGDMLSGFKTSKVGNFIASFSSKIKELKKGGISGIFNTLFGDEGSAASTGSVMMDNLKKLGGNFEQSGKLLTNATTTLKDASKTASGSLDFIKNTGEKLTESLSSFDWDKVLKGGWDAAKIYALIKGINAVEKFAKGTTDVATSLSSVLSSVSFVTDKVYKNLGASMKVKMIRDLAITIGILAGSIYLLSKIPAEDAYRSVAILTIVMGMLLGIANTAVKMTAKLREVSVIAVVFVAMAASILMLAYAMERFAGMGPKTIAKGLGLITLFIGMFILAGKAMRSVVIGGVAFAGMAVAINLLVPAIVALSKLKPATIVKGGIAIMYLMTELAIASRIARRSVKNAASMIAMAVAVNLLVPAIIILALIPFGKALTGALTIGVVLLSLAAAIKAASGMAKLTVWITITTAIAILCGSLIALALMPIDQVAAAATAITVVFGSLATALYMAQGFKSSKAGIVAMTLIVAEIGGIFYMLSKLPIENVLSISASLSMAIMSIAGSIAILTKIGVGGVGTIKAALFGIAAFDMLIADLIGVLSALGALNKISGFQDLLRSGSRIFKIIGEAIGGFFGSIAGGFIKGATSSLPYVGTQLSNFMTNLKPFLTEVKGLDPNVGKTIKNLASAVLMLSGSSFLDAINLFGKSDKFEEFGNGLTYFLDPLKYFVKEAKKIDEDSLTAAKNVANLIKTLATAAAEIPNSGGIAGGIMGNNDLDQFARFLASAAPNIKKAVDAAQDMPGENGKGFKRLRQMGRAIKVLAAAANEIPNTGGWAATFAGDNKINEFAQFIFEAAPNITAAANCLTDLSDDEKGLDNLKKVGPVIKSLALAAQEIPNSGGFPSIAGHNDLNMFAQYIYEAAPNITAAANCLTDLFDSGNSLDLLEKVGPVIKTLALAAKEIPNFGFSGNVENNQVSRFASYIADAAPDIADAANSLAGIKEGGLDNLKLIGPVIKTLASAAQDVTSITGNFEDLGTRLKGLGDGLSTFVTTVNGLQITNAEQISTLINSIAALATSSKEFDPTSFDGIIGVLGANGEKSFGASIASFCTAIAGVSTENLPAISTLIDAVSEAADKVKDGTFNGLKELGDMLPDLGANLKGFKDAIGDTKFKSAKSAANVLKSLSEITEMFQKFSTTAKKGSQESVSFDKDTFSAFTDSLDDLATKIANFAEEMKSVTTEDLEQKASDISSFISTVTTAISSSNKKLNKKGKNGIKNFLSGFKIDKNVDLSGFAGSLYKKMGSGKAFKSQGSKAGKSFIKGIEDAKGAKDAGEALLKRVKEGAPKDGLSGRGGDVGQGFADGIEKKTGAAYLAGQALFNEAKRAIEDAGKVESPSKVTKEIGGYVGEGFVIGLKKYNKEAYNEGSELAGSTIMGMNDNLYSEFGDPVIKPVLDMSDVKAGASRINGMFGATSINPTLIPNMRNNQNGGIDGELIKDAVDKMSLTITQSQQANKSPTYNIGDVTLEVNDLKDVLTLDQFVSVIKKAKAFS